MNVLLVEPGDIRHILFTIAKRRRHFQKKSISITIHFYLLETPLEIIGRDFLLLQLICDNELPIRQKANTFLEVYGNCRLQKRTAKYVEILANRLKLLMKVVANRKGNSPNLLEDVIDFSLLRYRERDELENIFGNFAQSLPSKFDALLDQRYRLDV